MPATQHVRLGGPVVSGQGGGGGASDCEVCSQHLSPPADAIVPAHASRSKHGHGVSSVPCDVPHSQPPTTRQARLADATQPECASPPRPTAQLACGSPPRPPPPPPAHELPLDEVAPAQSHHHHRHTTGTRRCDARCTSMSLEVHGTVAQQLAVRRTCTSCCCMV